MKKCEYCLHSLEADMKFCPNCGAPVPTETATEQIPTVQPTAAGATTQKTNGFAITALILAILSVFCCCFSPVFSILAIIFGAVALPQIAKQKTAGKEIAIVAIVLGSVMLLLSVIGGIVSIFTGEFTYDLDLPDPYEEPYDDYYDDYDDYDGYSNPFDGFAFDPFEGFGGFASPTPDTAVPNISEI